MVAYQRRAVPNPAIMPTLVNPGNRTDQAGANVNVQLNASDPNGDTLTFAASGLPPAITIDSEPPDDRHADHAGSFHVLVTAKATA